MVALVIDWMLCQLFAIGMLGMQWGAVSGTDAFLPLAVFFVENLLLVALLGTTIGHRLMGVQVASVRREGRRPSLLDSALRAALLCLVIPAIIMDANGRGLHDRAAGTVVLRAR